MLLTNYRLQTFGRCWNVQMFPKDLHATSGESTVQLLESTKLATFLFKVVLLITL